MCNHSIETSLPNITLNILQSDCPQQRGSLEPVPARHHDSLCIQTYTLTHTHADLSSSWEPDESFICSLNTSVTHSYMRGGRGAHETEAAEQNNKITTVAGSSTHRPRSSRQWRLLGNWGCQSASPAELLCSSCSSPTVPSQNKQMTKPPETSAGRERDEEKKRGRETWKECWH